MSAPNEQQSTNEPAGTDPADQHPESKPPAEVEEDANAQVESAEKPADEAQEASAEDAGSTDEGGDELPDWAREKLTKANSEAASYRTKLREAEDKIAKLPEEIEVAVTTATTKLSEENRALLIENIALSTGLPKKLHSRLVGNTREELEADAKELASDFAVDEEIRLEGGLRPRNRDADAGLTPRELAKKYGSRKR